MTEEDLELIGNYIDGTFSHYENSRNLEFKKVDNGDLLVFGSNCYPCHRVTVKREDAEKWIVSINKALQKSPKRFSD
jgi:hypothetical protein